MTFKHKITGTHAKLAEDSKYYLDNCSIGIPKQYIEDSKVWGKEDGYEILIFKSNRLSFYMPAIQKDGTYLDYPVMHCDGGGATLEWMLKEPEYYIYSIKRLSDGAVFTLGDKVKEGIIMRLRFVGDIYQYSCVEQHGWQILEKAVKVKEPIFVTKDGVEIYKNQPYWGLYTKTWLLEYVDEGIFYNLKEDELPDSTYLIFAKKENAENYIKENKPQYSLNDIRKVLNNELSVKHYTIFDPNAILEQLQNEIH